jgi:hypothetical protein
VDERKAARVAQAAEKIRAAVLDAMKTGCLLVHWKAAFNPDQNWLYTNQLGLNAVNAPKYDDMSDVQKEALAVVMVELVASGWCDVKDTGGGWLHWSYPPEPESAS